MTGNTPSHDPTTVRPAGEVAGDGCPNPLHRTGCRSYIVVGHGYLGPVYGGCNCDIIIELETLRSERDRLAREVERLREVVRSAIQAAENEQAHAEKNEMFGDEKYWAGKVIFWRAVLEAKDTTFTESR